MFFATIFRNSHIQGRGCLVLGIGFHSLNQVLPILNFVGADLGDLSCLSYAHLSQSSLWHDMKEVGLSVSNTTLQKDQDPKNNNT